MGDRWVWQNLRLLDPATGRDEVGDVAVWDGHIAALGPGAGTQLPAEATRYDGTGLWAAPAFIDLGTRLQAPEQDGFASWTKSLAAAAAGGYALLAAAPLAPATLTHAEKVQQWIAAGAGRVRPLVQGCRGPSSSGAARLSELGLLKQSGAVACVDFADRAVGHNLLDDGQPARRVAEYARQFGLALWLRPEHSSSRAGAGMHESARQLSLGLDPWPASSETVAVSRAIALCQESGVRLHLHRLSSAASLPLLRHAKGQGLPVTADVSLHHLHLTHADGADFDVRYRFDPPLRTAADRDALRAGLAAGDIDAVSSGHHALEPDMRRAPWAETPPGAHALRHAFAALRPLVPDTLSPLELVRRLSHAPAQILGLRTHGHLAVSKPAQLVLLNPDAEVAQPELTTLGLMPPLPLRGRVEACYSAPDVRQTGCRPASEE
ncbi:MAG: dihydroorotase [Polyangiales bacterium]